MSSSSSSSSSLSSASPSPYSPSSSPSLPITTKSSPSSSSTSSPPATAAEDLVNCLFRPMNPPALDHQNGHENLFETIAKLAGIEPSNYDEKEEMDGTEQQQVGGIDARNVMKMEVEEQQHEDGQEHEDGTAGLNYTRTTKKAVITVIPDKEEDEEAETTGNAPEMNNIGTARTMAAAKNHADLHRQQQQQQQLACFAANGSAIHPPIPPSSSSSRRKNVNPTRISDGNGKSQNNVLMKLIELEKCQDNKDDDKQIGKKKKGGSAECGEYTEKDERMMDDGDGGMDSKGTEQKPQFINGGNQSAQQQQQQQLFAGFAQPSTLTAPSASMLPTEFGTLSSLPSPFSVPFSTETAGEQQRRFYAQLIQQQQQQHSQQQNLHLMEMQRHFARFSQTLKEDLTGIFAASGLVEKHEPQMFGTNDVSAVETQAHAIRLLTALSMAAAARHHQQQQQQQQWAVEQQQQQQQGLAIFGDANNNNNNGTSARVQPPPPFPLLLPAGRLLPPTTTNASSSPLPPSMSTVAAAAANPIASNHPFHAFLAQNPLMAAMAAVSAAQQQHHQQQQATLAHSAAIASASIIPPPSQSLNATMPKTASIFPPTATNGFVPPPPQRPFAAVMPLQHQHQTPQMPLAAHQQTESDGSPRKKRAKVTDSVRGPRSSLHHNNGNGNNRNGRHQQQSNNNSHHHFRHRRSAELSATANHHYSSSSSSPRGNNSLFHSAPTMVPMLNAHNHHLQHPLFLRSPERVVQGVSPSAGEEDNDSSAGDDNGTHTMQLTHVHLRKAKLIFFYQRYPSSGHLKTYFPDVQFNKQNTAQLVKWFSNFREFFYMQMEKYAKQALAEGIKHREEIIITPESEIYKQLNQHYNKNTSFQPPERLQFVVQETLREFFSALQLGKDVEPSWKKVIYKIIQQLDEPIPEYFRDPQFIEMFDPVC